MTQPMFFQRRPEVVQAIQVTKDNHDAVKKFVATAKSNPYRLNSLDYLSSLWMVKDSDSELSIVTDSHMRKYYIQQNEAL